MTVEELIPVLRQQLKLLDKIIADFVKLSRQRQRSCERTLVGKLRAELRQTQHHISALETYRAQRRTRGQSGSTD